MVEARKLKKTILVVEDDDGLREAYVDTLELNDYLVLQARNGIEALDCLKQERVDMIVSDVNMPELDGLGLLKQVRQLYPYVPMLLVTAFGCISRSVDAMRAGAADYIVKPFEPDVLLKLVAQHCGETTDCHTDQPIAEDPSSQRTLNLGARVAVTDATVLITGESGTGKEVLARYIHQKSQRREKPFVAINCAAIPENMLEAILFGYEKGAFTGAHQSAAGKFEQANEGTLLLDEISEMDVSLQAKLLRVLQEQEVERLGGRKTIELNVRVLATSNRNLLQAVEAGEFREDLYYRLNVFPLHWQPLRERPLDIAPLAKYLIAQHAQKMSRLPVEISFDAEQVLLNHDWPGNIRELKNVVERSVYRCNNPHLPVHDLVVDPFESPYRPTGRVKTRDRMPESTLDNTSLSSSQPANTAPIEQSTVQQGQAVNNNASDQPLTASSLKFPVSLKALSQGYEVDLITTALANCQFNQKKTAEALGLTYHQLRGYLKKYNLLDGSQNDDE